jgi:hypothetical protein
LHSGLMSWRRQRNQRRLIMLICVSSFDPKIKLIDLTTVRRGASSL